MKRVMLILIGVICLAAAGQPQEVLDKDRALAVSNGWIYNDLPAGFAEARKTGKPLLVVIRCPP